MLMLTSTDDNKILAQCNNYEQIKKHLEQYLGSGRQVAQGQSTFDHRGSQKSLKANEKIGGTYEDVKLAAQGYNRDNMAQSVQS